MVKKVKNIIITGVTGQDGSHMADYLLKFLREDLGQDSFMLHGAVRRLSVKNHENILHLESDPNFTLIDMDLNDAHSIRDVIIDIQPDYFLNFAAQSFVAGSWKYPIQTWDTDANAVLHILESIRRFAPKCKFYNAGSSEEFGDIVTSPQSEEHPLRPQSPYGAAKCAARHLVRVYRESYNLFAVQGWLFNHEGVRRGLDFVTRKISNGVAKIKIALENGKEPPVLKLGNLDAQRDWTDAEDFMAGVWLMVNNKEPKEYVLASGEMHTVREFVQHALFFAEISYKREGSGSEEKFYTNDGKLIVSVDPKYYRPAEVHQLLGDPTKAEKELGWKRDVNFMGLVQKMVENDIKLLR